jgi:thioesterase domain-containing protein
MAEHFLRQIRLIQSEGPYYLGGLCAGGVIAFEAALQLEAQGQEVGLVTVFDAVHPRARACRTSMAARWGRLSLEDAPSTTRDRFGGRTLLASRRLGQRGIREVSGLLRLLLGRLRFRLLRQALDSGRALPPFVGNLGADWIYGLAELDYVPAARLLAPLLLFRAGGSGSLLPWFSDPTWGWDQSVQGRLEVVDVAGGHTEMFLRPHVTILAEHIIRRVILSRDLGVHARSRGREAAL